MKLMKTLIAASIVLASCGGAEVADTDQVPTTTPATTTTAPTGDDGLDYGPFVGSDPDGLIVDVEWLDSSHPAYDAQLPADSSGVGVLDGSEPELLLIGVNAGGCTPEVTVSVDGAVPNPELILEIGPPIVPEGLECIDLLKMYVFSVSLSEPVSVDDVTVIRSTDREAADGSTPDIIVSAGEDGSIPGDVVVGCSGNAMFPMSALSSIEPLDSAALPEVDAAMRTFLDGGEGEFWTQAGWMILHSTDATYMLVAVTESGGLEFIDVELVEGEWRWAGASSREDCRLQTAPPAGFGQVTWRLDPADPEPGPDATSVVVLVTETDCASGQAIGDRLVGPQIVATDSAIALAFAVVPLEGDQSCPSNPEQRVIVQLPEPLGDRALIDGLDLDLDLVDFLT